MVNFVFEAIEALTEAVPSLAKGTLGIHLERFYLLDGRHVETFKEPVVFCVLLVGVCAH